MLELVSHVVYASAIALVAFRAGELYAARIGRASYDALRLRHERLSLECARLYQSQAARLDERRREAEDVAL